MPKNHEFLPMSLVTFSRAAHEEIFLLYSKGFENGPGIHRNGQGSPWMIDPESQARKITDPHEQQKGTWFVDSDARKMVADSIPRWTEEVTKLRDQGLMERQDAKQRLHYYDTLRSTLSGIKDYHSVFQATYPDRQVVGIQGCGNLSMNEWYIAYLNSPFTGRQPVFIALPEDRVDRLPPRSYSCLVKYRDGNVRIETLVFNFLKERLYLSAGRKDITDDIEFAAYGTQVLRNDEIVDFRGIVEQIAD